MRFQRILVEFEWDQDDIAKFTGDMTRISWISIVTWTGLDDIRSPTRGINSLVIHVTVIRKKLWESYGPCTSGWPGLFWSSWWWGYGIARTLH
jgi:hypothetical protein